MVWIVVSFVSDIMLGRFDTVLDMLNGSCMVLTGQHIQCIYSQDSISEAQF